MKKTPYASGAQDLVSNHRHASDLDSNAEMPALWALGLLISKLCSETSQWKQFTHLKALRAFLSMQKLW